MLGNPRKTITGAISMTHIICHITSAHDCKDSRIFHKECKTLTQKYRVKLIAPNTESHTQDNVEIIGLPPLKNRFHRFFIRPYKTYKVALGVNADLYHYHDPDLLIVALLLKLKGKKVIYDIHEDFPRDILLKYYIPKPLRKLLSLAFEYVENKIVSKLDGIACATPKISDRFTSYQPNNITVKNYPLLHEFKDDPVPQSEKTVDMCYVGVIAHERGLNTMLAVAKTYNHTFTIAGWGKPKAIEDTIKGPGVTFKGAVSRPEVRDILTSARCGLALLFPDKSYMESLPIKMFEYMAAGIPVVVSDFPEWTAILDTHQCGLYSPPHDIEKIHTQVQFIIDNPDIAEEMGKRGREAVFKYYNWDNEAKKLFELYDTVLAS